MVKRCYDRAEGTGESQVKGKNEGSMTKNPRNYCTKAVLDMKTRLSSASSFFEHPQGRNKEESPSAVELR